MLTGHYIRNTSSHAAECVKCIIWSFSLPLSGFRESEADVKAMSVTGLVQLSCIHLVVWCGVCSEMLFCLPQF